MPFLTEAVMKPYGGNKWRMVEDFDYVTESGDFIRIPHGFVHDLASIPRPLNLLFRKHGRHTSAAILHDWAYHTQGQITGKIKLNRLQSDELFLEAMKASGVGYFKRVSMYYAVRLGGYLAWKD